MRTAMGGACTGPRAATVTAALERAAGVRGTGLRLLDRRERERWLGWDEVAERAHRVGAGLTALGIGRGERVAVVFPTGAGFFAAFFGALAAGAVPVPLYPPLRLGGRAGYAERTAALLAAAGARIVLHDGPLGRFLDETVRRARPELGARSLEELPAGSEGGGVAHPEPQDAALVQFSSGTTSTPKPVLLSHRALMTQAEILNGYWPDVPGAEGDCHSGVSWLPLYHDMGLVGCVLPALERPGVLTLLPPELFAVRPAVWLRTVSRFRATLSPAPTFGFAYAAERVRDEELAGVELGSWRIAPCGAELVVPAVLERFVERFARWGMRPEAPTPVYGLAEAALAVTFSGVDTPPVSGRFDRDELSAGRARPCTEGVEIASVGRPVPGFEVAVLAPGKRPSPDASRSRLPAGRVGRVWVRGPSLMDGYLDLPETTARNLVSGWLDTGDLGFLLDGELYITGRGKDVVVVRGRNHPPEDLERAVDAIPGARPGAAVAASARLEDNGGERVLLLVEVRRETSPEVRSTLPEAVRRAVLARTGVEVERVAVVEPASLPRTSSGKLRRGEAVARYRAGRLPVLEEA